MKQYSILSLAGLLLFTMISFSSCTAIGDIFKAGVWVGIIVVVIIVALIIWLVGKSKN